MPAEPAHEDRRTRAELIHALAAAHADTNRARDERDEAREETSRAIATATADLKQIVADLQDDLRTAQETHAGECGRFLSQIRRHERTIAGLAVQLGLANAANSGMIDSEARRDAVAREQHFHRLEVTAAGANALAAEDNRSAGDAA